MKKGQFSKEQIVAILQQAEKGEQTREIERPETELNARVYGLFGLTAPEIAGVEESTK